MSADGVFLRAFSSTIYSPPVAVIDQSAGNAFCSTHGIVGGNRAWGKTRARAMAQSLIGIRIALKTTKSKVLTCPVSKVMNAIDPLIRYKAPTVYVRHV